MPFLRVKYWTTDILLSREVDSVDFGLTFGVILNIPSDFKFMGFVPLPWNRKHWITLKYIPSRDAYYNLDSNLTEPALIGKVLILDSSSFILNEICFSCRCQNSWLSSRRSFATTRRRWYWLWNRASRMSRSTKPDMFRELNQIPLAVIFLRYLVWNAVDFLDLYLGWISHGYYRPIFGDP